MLYELLFFGSGLAFGIVFTISLEVILIFSIFNKLLSLITGKEV